MDRYDPYTDKFISDVPNTNVWDTISRQAVMRAIDEALIGKGCSADGTMTARLINDYVIRKVPPAEPEKRTEERTETHACDCIERHTAIKPPRKEN